MQIMTSLLLGIFLVYGAAFYSAMNGQGREAIDQARQLIIVTTKDWDAVDGKLQRFERSRVKGSWRPVGEAIPIVVGRNGMAWGKGLHGEPAGEGPIKKEGDGRSPAGVFSLSAAFGYQSKTPNVKLPYLQATPSLECVDDVKSHYYNRVLDRGSVKRPDWQSSEQMRRHDDLYRLGVIVDHNAQRESGCGSCIFLHIWEGAGQGTAGCTAMTSQMMEEILHWLDARKKPLLIQLPQARFEEIDRINRFFKPSVRPQSPKPRPTGN